MPSLNFKIAGEPWEFEQIHRLVYQGFVEEIPYLSPNAEQRLVDRFHAENTYAIASDGGHVVGMCAIRDRRPFSLDQKLANLDDYLPPHKKVGVAAAQESRGVSPALCVAGVSQWRRLS